MVFTLAGERCGLWSGVPQGSVLGPVLFLTFINDTDSGLYSNVLKFADDTKVFSVIEGYVDGCGLQGYIDGCRLQADLRNIEKWAEMWQMEFSVQQMQSSTLRQRQYWIQV